MDPIIVGNEMYHVEAFRFGKPLGSKLIMSRLRKLIWVEGTVVQTIPLFKTGF